MEYKLETKAFWNHWLWLGIIRIDSSQLKAGKIKLERFLKKNILI